MEIELLRDVLVPKHSNHPGDRLSLEQSYTLNDSRMDGNAVYADNRFPGIPVQVYEAQLRYQSPLGSWTW